MEERISCKSLKVSAEFKASYDRIYYYSVEMFGYFQAERYDQKIANAIETLPDRYLTYPVCRHIPTKSRMYRNIILDAHIIIYRITAQHIEILDIIHFASSIKKIRSARKIKLHN